jgi:protein tyrosine/serine phosphatase
MARANQPSPKQIARYAKLGIKTILNLRGESPTGYFALEQEACAANGIALVNAPMGSREAPPKHRIHFAKETFQTIAYPALMHCKSGADRAGIMAVLYLHFHRGLPIADAINQLSFKYLHVKQGKTGMLDFFFQSYLEDNFARPMPFLQWVDEVYEPDEVKARFHASWWGTMLTEKILKRE